MYAFCVLLTQIRPNSLPKESKKETQPLINTNER